MPFLNWINDDIARRQYKNVAFHLLEKQEHYGASDASNLLIQGDNLIALRALLPFYKGKVKCIYIDPPYNTVVRLLTMTTTWSILNGYP